MSLRRTRIWLPLTALMFPLAPVGAQSWEILDEIDFAKSLARYRLFDFANEHLDNLERSGDLPGEDATSVIFAPWGVAAAHKLPPEILRRVFGIYLITVGVTMISKKSRKPTC